MKPKTLRPPTRTAGFLKVAVRFHRMAGDARQIQNEAAAASVGWAFGVLWPRPESVRNRRLRVESPLRGLGA